jgi:dodecin
MADKVYKKVRLVGCSAKGIEDAVRLAVFKADDTLHGLAWFEVAEVRGAIKDKDVTEWQVSIDVGFKVD